MQVSLVSSFKKSALYPGANALSKGDTDLALSSMEYIKFIYFMLKRISYLNNCQIIFEENFEHFLIHLIYKKM